MNYLRKKLQAIMACADFKGYLREVAGYPLTLTDCMGSDLVSLSVTGNAAQGGTPSPDAPVEVQGVGERTANLFDISNRTELQSVSVSYPTMAKEFNNNIIVGLASAGYWDSTRIVSYSFDGDNFTLQSSAGYGLGFDFDVSEGETYTVSYTATITGSNYVAWYDAEGMYMSRTSINRGLASVTVPDGAAKLVLCFVTFNNSTMTVSKVQVIEGSYTTDTMPPFEPYGYKVPVEVGGINLFNLIGRTEVQLNGKPDAAKEIPDNSILLNVSSNGFNSPGFLTSYSVDDNCVTIVPSSNSGYGLGFSFSVAEGDTYTMSYSADALAEVYASFYDTEGIYLSRSVSKQITVPPNAVMMVITIVKKYETHSDNIGIPISVTNLMLVKGAYTADTMPAYEPYHEPQTVNVYADKPLYAVGDVGDTITLDFDAKTATRTENVGSFTFNGSETWNLNSSVAAYNGDKTTCRYNATTGLNGTYTSISGFCDRLPYKTGAIWGMNIAEECFAFNSNQVHMRLSNDLLGITSDDDSATRTAKFKAWLSANATTVLGKRATPTTTDITALQDWDAMPSTWRGTVVISAATSVPPSSVTAKYYATKKED